MKNMASFISHLAILKLQNAARDYYRLAAHAHLVNSARRAFDFQTNPAGTINKITLFNSKLVNAIHRINPGGVVIHEITTQRSGRAARRRIFTDVLSDKESRVRPRLANFHRLAREGITASRASTRKAVAGVDFFQQRNIRLAPS